MFLPEPRIYREMSVEEAIFKRRSIREYSEEPLRLEDLSQILWAAQGVTNPNRMFRSAPSAGATYPLEIYVVVKEVEGLEPGVYRYIPIDHSLKLIREGDHSYHLYRACINQKWVLDAKANLIITAVYERTTSIYGERGIRYVHMEAGHVGQNIYLQSTALGVGTVAVGAFYDEYVEEVVGCGPEERALYVFPLGYER
ncbi:nitroreductase [Methanofervidicoccus sp. A16]|uniref:SagB/ThcOx family dehydrogenase n=1 Tax=Methanofervidicoccus sp. A16 TaxID=2607662 RepID=UPI001187EB26|nr:SagB/ThcOx family dehydrogenase [Methanofervidicoccus sp. A16]AXI25581.1 nitroreductase [Methanofervidicoccus sp. A16]